MTRRTVGFCSLMLSVVLGIVSFMGPFGMIFAFPAFMLFLYALIAMRPKHDD